MDYKSKNVVIKTKRNFYVLSEVITFFVLHQRQSVKQRIIKIKKIVTKINMKILTNILE